MPYLRSIAGLVLACAWLHGAEDPRDPMQLLAQARVRIVAMTHRLPRYTCVQTVERRYFGVMRRGRGGTPPKSCPQVLFDKNSGKSIVGLVVIDRLRLDVAVSASGEIYSWVGASRFDTRPLAEMIGGGAVSTGAFGTYLVDVFDNPGAAFHFLHKTSSGGRVLFEYSYRVPVESSHYEVGIPDAVKSGLIGSWHVTGHEGTFTIDSQSLDLVHLTIRSDVLPPVTDMCQATTSLDYQRLQIGGQDFLLPRTSALELVGTDAHETRTLTTFSGCRQYGAESTVQFGDETEAAAGAGKTPASAPVSLPAWLPVTLALVTPIDTDTAAVGDPIRARVSEPVRPAGSKEVLVPAGAILKGRITRMEHRLASPGLFLIGMAFDSLEVNGAASPCRLTLDATHLSRRQLELTADLPAPENGAVFPFPSSKPRIVVPAGYKMIWLTAKPAKP